MDRIQFCEERSIVLLQEAVLKSVEIAKAKPALVMLGACMVTGSIPHVRMKSIVRDSGY